MSDRVGSARASGAARWRPPLCRKRQKVGDDGWDPVVVIASGGPWAPIAGARWSATAAGLRAAWLLAGPSRPTGPHGRVCGWARQGRAVGLWRWAGSAAWVESPFFFLLLFFFLFPISISILLHEYLFMYTCIAMQVYILVGSPRRREGFSRRTRGIGLGYA